MSEKTYRAIHRRAPMSARKARYVVDLIRGKPVNEALDILRFCPRRAAPMLSKIVWSALASAQLDEGCDPSRLHVVDCRADEAHTLRRWKTRSRGQMYPLLLRHSHLTVVLAERDAAEKRRRSRGATRSRRARVEASRAAQQKTNENQEAGAAEGSEGNG